MADSGFGWLSIDRVFFTAFGYRMSYVEFAGTLLNLWCVWLAARGSIWNWPIGNLGVVLFGVLFYQIQLYSDLVEQGYFLITGFYGWWLWRRSRRQPAEGSPGGLRIGRVGRATAITLSAVTVAGTAVMGAVMSRIHRLWPSLFPVPASFPYLDALTTVMSFVAQLLMAHRKLESWYLWIAVDVIGVGLYWAKGVVFVALLYAIFLVLAVRGCFAWRRAPR